MTVYAQTLASVPATNRFTNLPPMWLTDRWCFTRGEVPGVSGELSETVRLDWTGVQPSLGAELKWATATRCLRGDWRAQNLASMRSRINHLLRFLRQEAPDASSLLDRDLAMWELQLRSYLVTQGVYRARNVPSMVRSAPGGVKDYLREDLTIRVFRQLHGMIAEELDPRDEYDKDVWNLQRLGIAARASSMINYLKFTRIRQAWLKDAIKRYCRYTLARGAVSSAHEWIDVASSFSEYLAEAQPGLTGAEMCRNLLLGFGPFLERCGHTANRRYSAIIHLRTILEHCGREGWGGLPDRVLLYKQDLPARTAAIPRFIPDEVVQILNAHLDDLPEDQQRMLLVIQEVGMRGSELCEAPFDCLLHDNDGDYFFLYYQGKMRKEHHVPISRQLALVVKEQQAYVRDRFGSRALTHLFPSRGGRPYQRRSLAPIINALAHKHDIRGPDGQRFWFRSHGFRHRVGTSMINNGVPQHIVQRFLGHESPQMTSVYAHIMDTTLKRAIEEYREKKVDISGAIMPDVGVAVPDDALVLKRNVQAQALPNGQCHLPVQAGPCPHANACLTCGHFRSSARFLPVLKQQLADAERIVDWARDNAAQRVLEMNERVAGNLHKMIAALDGGSTLVEVAQLLQAD